jgi:hypothetical protein
MAGVSTGTLAITSIGGVNVDWGGSTSRATLSATSVASVAAAAASAGASSPSARIEPNVGSTRGASCAGRLGPKRRIDAAADPPLLPPVEDDDAEHEQHARHDQRELQIAHWIASALCARWGAHPRVREAKE